MSPPLNWVCLPPGDAGLTRRVKAAGPSWAVVEKRGRKVNVRVDGPLTAAESAGDLSGLAVAFRAYQLSLQGRPSPIIDGLTGEQRFFMGWARMWRSKEREEYIRSALHTVPYLPAALRANAAASNVGGFFDAFAVKPADRLYRPPAERIRIW